MNTSIRKICSLTILFIMMGYLSLDARNIYVDPSISLASVSTYNKNALIGSRDSGGTDLAYRTIQGAFNAMFPGDHIYIRGGRYTENFGNSYTAIQCPVSANGDSWEEGHYSKVSSYPGEWAILDGSSNSKYVVIGNADSGHGTVSNDLRYWIFERLEVTGGNKGGFGIWRGPVIVRYCYIHDNYDGTGDENPSGFRAYHLQDSIIEYCWFNNNAGTYHNENCAHIQIFNDYQDCFNTVDISGRAVVRNNEIRYNYFEGSTSVGIKHKGNGQCLTDENSPNLSNKALGDKWHHNIITGTTYAIDPRIDYMQVYNNICDGGYLLMSAGVSGSGIKQKFYNVAYNNTVIGQALWYTVGYNATYCGITYPLTSYYPRATVFNNIVAQAASGWDHGQISLAGRMASGTNTFNATGTSISRNLIYKPQDNDHFMLGRGLPGDCDYDEGGGPQVTFDALYGWVNYSSSTDGLFLGTSGANRYKTNGSFTIGSGRTVLNGGFGGTHPYLTGVTIPSYVGAVDPNNSEWVDTVLGLTNIENLIGGSVNVSIPPTTPSDTTPPSSPSGVNINIIQ